MDQRPAGRTEPIVSLKGVGKTYETPAGAFTALADIDLTLTRGDFVAVVGKSGSGKSTLINLLTGIDRPTTGEIAVAGMTITGRSESQLAAWRGRSVGIVFQFFQLLPTLTVAENVMLAMDFGARYPVRERRGRALDLLGEVGIREQAGKLPAMLSGGQQQRAAIARALANEPPLLVADEPTGNLDSRTADDILALFSRLAGSGTTVIVVTHEREVAGLVDRVVALSDGRIESDASGGRNRAAARPAA